MKMKRLFTYVLVALFFVSCGVPDDTIDFYHEFMPVDSVEIPEELHVNETYQIVMSYTRPSDCYVFSDIYYVYESPFERTVSIICKVYNNNENCDPLTYPAYDAIFNFTPTNTGTYVFNFWQGLDDNGENLFLTVEVPVTE